MNSHKKIGDSNYLLGVREKHLEGVFTAEDREDLLFYPPVSGPAP